jgi:DNA-binding MltR family transcriptional regulator
MSDLNDVYKKLEDCETALGNLKVQVAVLETKLDALVSKSGGTDTIIKYVVTPLLVIVGALVGVKLVLPNT